MTDTILGYLVWERTGKGATAAKVDYDIWHGQLGLDAKTFTENKLIGQPIPLRDIEWRHLTLAELMARYPCKLDNKTEVHHSLSKDFPY
jgi:hypothetical protein